jgi:integrase
MRTVPLLAVLRDYLDEQLLGTGRSGADLVFGRTPVDSFVASTVSARADCAWNSAGLDRITPHGCLHTFASMLIAAGENPRAVQEFMGHSTITMTFDLYGHLFPGAATRRASDWTRTSTRSCRAKQRWDNDPPFRRDEAARCGNENRLN